MDDHDIVDVELLLKQEIQWTDFSWMMITKHSKALVIMMHRIMHANIYLATKRSQSIFVDSDDAEECLCTF